MKGRPHGVSAHRTWRPGGAHHAGGFTLITFLPLSLSFVDYGSRTVHVYFNYFFTTVRTVQACLCLSRADTMGTIHTHRSITRYTLQYTRYIYYT